MIVLDVSFVMKLLKKEISFNIFSEDDKFIAPYLFDYEIANVLWKIAKFQGLIPTDVRNLIKAVNSLGIEKEQLDIWKLFDCAKETGLTAYDASYLILARKHECPLATCDKQLAQIAKQEEIEVIEGK
ncbi:MAG: type II toxin-antitoxin system VapC family toxin [Alphaproteobacteria bacterium]|nr:type II toxin-antitoxin system VapC family toxin [Alphaproteobacteria bacterium]